MGTVLHALLAISSAHVAADTALHDALTEMDAATHRIGSLSAGRPATAASAELSQLWQNDDQQLVSFAADALRHLPAEQLRASAQTLEQTERQFAIAYGRDLPATSVDALFTTLQGPTHALQVAMVDVVAHKPKASWDVAAAEDGMAGLAAVLAKAVMLEGQPA